MEGVSEMNRLNVALVILSLGMSAARTGFATIDGTRVQTSDLQPFTHFAKIPANADIGAIRFESIRKVKLPTRVVSTMNSNYCHEAGFRDPGGSMFCPYVETAAHAIAYEVRYSYRGPALSSDEFGNQHFTFQVYFRPDELSPEIIETLSGGKAHRRGTAALFTVNTHREAVRRVVIDEAHSRFCEGNYIDGGWTHNDGKCKDEVRYRAILAPDAFITVQVDPVPPRSILANSRAK
jgi:hypothetical protein